VVIYERHIAFDKQLAITTPSLPIAADRERDVAITSCFDANNATTPNPDRFDQHVERQNRYL
jgi:hypothetical protein